MCCVLRCFLTELYNVTYCQVISAMGFFLKPFVHNSRNLTCNVPRKPHQDRLWENHWQQAMVLTVNLFLMTTDVHIIAAQLFLSRHVRTSDDAISCLPRWLAQMIASPAYSSSVICPYNTYTHSHTHTIPHPRLHYPLKRKLLFMWRWVPSLCTFF